jgi:beta-lactamase regulating signal transducer with metallopeptidase domain
VALSYNLRFLVLILLTVGFIQAFAEIALWTAAPLILRYLPLLSTRYRERLLYLLQFAPLLTGMLFAGFLFVPQYLRNETNSKGEDVGWVCLLLAFGMLLAFGFALLRGLSLSTRTLRFAIACRKTCRISSRVYGGTPIRILSDQGHGIMLVGFFHPFVLVSRSLIEEELSEAALNVVLAHENAHAAQLDNWKLGILYFLPRLPLTLPGGGTWMELWRTTAEWAADDDAIRGDNMRALLLAEAVVRVARQAGGRHLSLVSVSLSEPDRSLAMRLDRLLHRGAGPSPAGPALFALPASILGVAGAAVILSPRIYDIAEWILHLG